ncbi:ATP-DEPENDENT RNA HELICASE DBP3 [Salix purpurea]|uniref:RNA helicase n=1 Tax=Salix purpurea TaxID=77065 RepID=A0A9Q0QFW1_SALPP|nr:ATP-DEPENDENT RNA HELICASE DBP3 [Salix purpurea]
MGKKIREANLNGEPIAQQESANGHKSDKKKRKDKNKNQEPEFQETQKEPTVKRKLEETQDQETVKKEKKKKHKEEKEGEIHEGKDKESGNFPGSTKKDKEKKKDNNKQDENGKESVICEVEEEKKPEERVVVSGKGAQETKYAPLKSFAEAKLPDNVLECCKNFKSPSPIQAHAWPFLLDGRDFIGIAKTGSGKTLAFGIPAIMHILSKRKGKSTRGAKPLCLVLAPTRELADQIAVVIRDAGEPCGVRSVCIYGGTSKGPQITSLKAGADIVIGTPGRLKDLIEMDVLHLAEVSFVVLDEADRMLDMGFRQEVRSILSNTCSARQMIMFSATWPLDVHNLADEYMDPNPIKVVAGSEDTAANHDVMQIVEVLDDHLRDQRLLALLEKYHKSQQNRVLVFALYQKEAERLDGMLRKSGWKVVSIHGNKAQEQRTKALSLFKKGSCPLMVATDVAARGLDVPDVEVVINYTFPLTVEDYVHRIGRTGRAGKKGVAHTFFTHHNKGLTGELVNVLREAGQIVPPALLKFGTHVKKKESKLYGAHFKEISADAPKAKKITFNSDDED